MRLCKVGKPGPRATLNEVRHCCESSTHMLPDEKVHTSRPVSSEKVATVARVRRLRCAEGARRRAAASALIIFRAACTRATCAARSAVCLTLFQRVVRGSAPRAWKA